MDFAKRAKLALAVLAGVAIAAAYTVYLLREDLKPWNVHRAKFAKVVGLKKKDPVLLGGLVIGRVAAVELFEDANLATLELEPSVVLRAGAEAEIVPRNSFGDVQVELREGKQKERLGPDDVIPGTYRSAIRGSPRGAIAAHGATIRDVARASDAVVRGQAGAIASLITDRDKVGVAKDFSNALGNAVEGARNVIVATRRGEGFAGALTSREGSIPVRDTVADLRGVFEGARSSLRAGRRGELTGLAGLAATDDRARDVGHGVAASAAASLRAYRHADEDAALRGFLTRDERAYGRLAGGAEALADTTGAGVQGEGLLGTLTAAGGGDRFKAGLGSLSHALDDALRGNSTTSAILAPGEDRRRAMEELVGRVENAITDFRDAGRGLRQGTANTTLQGALFTIF